MGILNSNEAINAFGKFVKGVAGGAIKEEGMFGGIRGSIENAIRPRAIGTMVDENMQAVGSLINEDRTGIWQGIKNAHKASEGQMSVGGYSVKKIAGSYMGVSAGYRIASGGGVYKDSGGNADLIGVPFI